MTNLEKIIKDAAQKYYSDGTSPISDEMFDTLTDKLREENPESSALSTGWGYEPELDTTGDKVHHKYGKAGSLDKVHNIAEMPKDFTIHDASLKLDGLSIVMYYVNGQFNQALTRGDGAVGIDITSKVMKLVPSKLKRNFTGAIRGEIVMSLSNFEEFKLLHPEAKNPRNSAAGLINSKNMQDDIDTYLEVVAYTVVGWENSEFSDWLDIEGDSDMRFILTRLYPGNIVPHIPVSRSFTSSEFDTLMQTLKIRWYVTYPADGIVLTDSYSHDSSSSEITWNSVAYKYPTKAKEAVVEDVEWGVSKTGYLVPRVRITPTEISGSTVRYCTGYNARYIEDNNIQPGTIVTFSKKGEIIPNIEDIIYTPPTKAELPTHCPVCNSDKIIWQGVNLQCNNIDCPDKDEKDILIWCDNIAPIEGLSDALRIDIINSIKSANGVTRYKVEDLMADAEDAADDISADPTSKSHAGLAKAFWMALSSKKSIKLSSALKALNIPRLGDKTADKLANYPELVKELMDDIDVIESESFYTKMVNAIGDANTQAIYNNSHKFNRLAYIASRIEWDCKPLNLDIAIQKVAITGKLSVKRSEFEAELISHGFAVTDLTKDCKYLITDDPNSNSSKNKKATQWGIIKISEADFRNTYF